MNNSRQRLSFLLERYTEKTATRDELLELTEILKEDWHQLDNEKDVLNMDWQKMLDTIIVSGKNPVTVPVKRFTIQRLMKYAAIILLTIGVAGWFWHMIKKEKSAITAGNHFRAKSTIAPGHDGAILTLESGKQIVLDSLGNGMVASQSGARVVLANGQLRYDPTDKITGTVAYNTMSTPKGRQFNMMLPDGTRVWLNSASSIRYPTAFKGGERTVEIKGEVYFEVAKDKARPFMVKTTDMEVEVLGTNFNINAYEDEEAVTTTLLEGSIRTTPVNPEGAGNGVVLKPGQQALVSQTKNGSVRQIKVVDRVAIEKVMAWKNGLFNFEDASLEVLMRQISRWYDIEIVFEKGVPDMQFGGKMSRNVELSDVLKALKGSGVHFRIEGRRLIVLP